MRVDISQKLLNWYDLFARSLPWRKTQDSYKIWISEVMLQQTTVKAVIPYYNRWMEEFPDIQTLSRSPLDHVLKMWQGLGYYSRAQNIHKTAKIIVNTKNGQMPSNKKELLSLPGIGKYTASAILSIAFGAKEAVVETNIRRIVLRLMCVKDYANAKQDPLILNYLNPLLPSKRMSCFNQALMDFGAMVCRSKDPHCLLCCLKKNCLAFQKEKVCEIPLIKKKIFIHINVCLSIIHHNNQFFIRKRPEKGLWGGLWEFPGGKQKKEENLEQTLHRAIYEDFSIKIQIKKKLKMVRHSYTQFKVKIYPFLCTLDNESPDLKNALWVELSEIDRYPMPIGNVKILHNLKKILA